MVSPEHILSLPAVGDWLHLGSWGPASDGDDSDGSLVRDRCAYATVCRATWRLREQVLSRLALPGLEALVRVAGRGRPNDLAERWPNLTRVTLRGSKDDCFRPGLGGSVGEAVDRLRRGRQGAQLQIGVIDVNLHSLQHRAPHRDPGWLFTFLESLRSEVVELYLDLLARRFELPFGASSQRTLAALRLDWVLPSSRPEVEEVLSNARRKLHIVFMR